MSSPKLEEQQDGRFLFAKTFQKFKSNRLKKTYDRKHLQVSLLKDPKFFYRIQHRSSAKEESLMMPGLDPTQLIATRGGGSMK